MSTKHSPTPWRVSALDYWTIVAEGKRIAQCVLQDESTIVRRRDEKSGANASMIVRAVNAHDALVSALEAMLEVSACRAHMGAVEAPVRGCDCCVCVAAVAARAALRAARGEA